ncbi:MAG TPA: N-6 DNA methylase [Sedimentisphaerales bacterium]|nr:N-6 DNA methylase [Sedimentisphaerales bacterium]
MTKTARSVATLRPLIEECGYSGTRLGTRFRVGDDVFPLVGFASKPWDFDSACIAVTAASDKSEDAVKACRQLGAPIVWVWRNGTVEWWTQHSTTPTLFDSRPVDQFAALIREHKADLLPESVYRAKVLGRMPGAKQLSFVDVGLMPLLRGEAGAGLGSLVENMTLATLQTLGQDDPNPKMLRNVFTCVFRLLAGKILKNKDVGDFGRLNLGNPEAVLGSVAKHYSATDGGVGLSRQWQKALLPASELLSQYGDLRVVSPETLAYVYEHTLVSKALRKKLGVHATPPYLVDYIVWQLYDWVREIPPEDRHIFEPACGHAPFLLATMRMLRMEMQGENPRKIHSYLQNHIHGIEFDGFAREIARLSLTLADIPNPNGWDLKPGDMFASDVLTREATRCAVMLANPPYERFTRDERTAYARAGMKLGANTKACEMLRRTIPHMTASACLGVVVPQGLLHSDEGTEIRRTVLSDFELREIDVFGDKLFEKSDHEVAVLIGRRKKNAKAPGTLWFRRAKNTGIDAFRDRFVFSSEELVDASRFAASPSADLRVPELDVAWYHLANHPLLEQIATLGQGLAFLGKDLPKEAWTIHDPPQENDHLGFANVPADLNIFDVPPKVGMNLTRSVLLHVRAGMPPKMPQVLLNYARVSREPWRLKATLDETGYAITSRFIAVRPIQPETTALYLWAVLNSPLANAFASCHSGKRDILVGSMRRMPVPRWSSTHAGHIEQAAMRYRTLAASPGQLFDAAASSEGIKQALLEMDAAVLRAYDLPTRLERQLLDFFNGVERKGVGCTFTGYFPPDFESVMPLHKYISSAYRQSTIDEVAARLKPGKSEHVLASLRSAAKAFGEDS